MFLWNAGFLKKLEKKPTAEDQPAIKQDILFEFPGLGIGLGDFFHYKHKLNF